jgi:PAS domain S-box-containing protein
MSMQPHFSTLASIHQPIFVVHAEPPDYPIAFVNAALSSITGYEPEELLGKGCALLFGEPDDTALARKQLASALQPPPGQATRAAVRDGKLARLLSVSEVCESDQRYYIALAGSLDKRGAAEQAPPDMGQVAHDLRAPLSACVAWIDLLELKGGNSPEIATAVAAIKRNLERQGRLIDDLVNRFGGAG